jgi:hypothetical protein
MRAICRSAYNLPERAFTHTTVADATAFIGELVAQRVLAWREGSAVSESTISPVAWFCFTPAASGGLFEPMAGAVHRQDADVTSEPIEPRCV